MDSETKGFYQGWAVMAAFMVSGFGAQTHVEYAIQEHGITLELLKQAEVDSYDMEILRPYIDKRFSTYCAG